MICTMMGPQTKPPREVPISQGGEGGQKHHASSPFKWIIKSHTKKNPCIWEFSSLEMQELRIPRGWVHTVLVHEVH